MTTAPETMPKADHHDPFAPDRLAQAAILCMAVVSGLLLLVAYQAYESKVAWFASRTLQTLWLTLAIVPPLLAALTVQKLGDRRFLLGIGGTLLVLGYVGWYAGRAMQPDEVDASPVIWPYVFALIGSGHVAAAWLSVWLTRTDFSYPRLFDAAWRHVSTLSQVFAYTGAFWLLLVLWGKLFKALGIGFFEDLFETATFAYPVTSFVAGYGLVLARTKSSLSDAVHLRILALWRGLLPLAAVLALAFAAALMVQGVQPLWDTRHATQLLLALVVALVALSNAAYGKGGEAPLHPLLKRLVQAALLLLPLFVALAAWALSLRWQQYGLSLDRLWAALSIGIAAVYALGYARAALRRDAPWLAGIASVNRAASLITASALLLTQTGVLDFRAITAHALRERAATLNADDLRYLRWNLGSPGLTALAAVQMQRAASDPVSAQAIAELIAQKARYVAHDEQTAQQAATSIDYRQPQGAAAPPVDLLAALRAKPTMDQHFDRLDGLDEREHWLIEIELDNVAPTEWLRVTLSPPATPRAETGSGGYVLERKAQDQPDNLFESPTGQSQRVVLDVFQQQGRDWILMRREQNWHNESQKRALLAALQSGQVIAVRPQWLAVQIGEQRFHFDQAP